MAGARPIVACQGSHSLADAIAFTGDADTIQRSADLADAGFHQIAGDLSQTATQGTFGNSTSATRVGQLRAYLQGTLGAAAGPVDLRSGSGGFAAAVRYAKANPANVRTIIGMNPLVDLRDLHDNNRGGFAAEVETAFGGAAGYAADVASGNASEPGTLGPLAAIPILLFYARDDPYIPVATVTAFRAAVLAAGGSCEIESMGAVGHTAPVAAAPSKALVEFLAAHP
jgi:pimeloyl-ACP methyl ester carboxylesterase